jgi:hypothetical protein
MIGLHQIRKGWCIGCLGWKAWKKVPSIFFLDLVINKRIMQALIDLGEYKEKEKNGVSSSIYSQIDKWEGWGSSTMMPMDEFEVNIQKEFLRRKHSVIMPWMDKMAILGEQKAWVLCKLQGILMERCNFCVH